ncbi:hypothetical protein [Pedobacter aquatilis]|uniref:hypothetical protein n=1 Tax=Pedobacter aquatilis TaxID=351343 RepID=UPI00292EEBC4|nr:hypothetical protein [Pedobacter aquatilis]
MITIQNAPASFTPAGNPIIFQLTSDNSNIVYFQVQVVQVPSNQTIINQKFYVRPDYPNGVSFNLSSILSNLVETKVNNSPNVLAAAIDDASVSYRLIITEKINDNGVVISGAVYNVPTDNYTVWNAKFDRLLFTVYNQNEYVVNGSYTCKFLSLKEQISKQSATSTEHLYFINNGLAAKARIRLYNIAGVQVANYIANLPAGNVIRLNVSPKTLYNLYGADFTNIGHYRVDLLDGFDNVVSQEKVYLFGGYPCHLQPVNLLWTNSLGGVESFTLFNPIESIAVAKTKLKTNPLQLDNGVYSDHSNGIINPTEKLISSSSESTFKIFSDVLTDEETIMLKELITSENVYLELSDNQTLLPINIKETNYDVLLRRTNGYKLNRLNISYSTQSGFIPSKSDLFGSGVGSASIQFINMPVPPTYNNGVVYHNASNGTVNL